jgi:anti-sigma regulatory factor (Ser/Thr protein kinase)
MFVGFSISLPRDPTASRLARAAVGERLGPVVSASTLSDVTLAVSELVTNAVVHGAGRIELRVEAGDRVVKGEVIDDGAGFERQIRDAGPDGRGLRVVGQLADHWGVFQGTTHVWFEIPRDRAGQTPTAPAVGRPDDERLPEIRPSQTP